MTGTIPDRQNAFLDRLKRGELTLMLTIRSSRTADVVRIAQATGHHAIMVDLEHSTISLDVAALLCTAAADLGMTPFVRLPERDYGSIGRLLDCGAQGLIAPRVQSADDAAIFANACRFPPRGSRSQLATVPQFGMRPMPARELNPALQAATIVTVLIETPFGIENADGIAGQDGVDIVAIGPNDLTAEFGVPGDYASAQLRDAVATVADACQRHGKLLMLSGISDLARLAELLPRGGCHFQLSGTDTELLFAGAQTRVQKFADWDSTNRMHP
jgi:2-keto-3-deoxy-L-rhamnonate aldolase RhmA